MKNLYNEPTPMLFGEAAREFKRRMQNVQKETPEERERRLRNYEAVVAMLEEGEKIRLRTRNDE